MFIKKYQISIENGYIMDFVNSLGKFGVRFEVGDLCVKPDRRDVFRSTSARVFTVHTTKKQFNEIWDDFKHRIN